MSETRRHLLLAGAVVALVLAAPASHAQVGGVEPLAPFEPRSLLLVDPIGLYVAPDAQRGGLGGLSLVSLRRALERAIDADPRLQRPDRALLPLVLELQRETALADLRAIAQQNARAGLASFRQFEMATAVDELTQAIAAWEEAGGAYTDPDELADAWFYLALAWLQVASDDPARAATAAANIDLAFRAVVRLDPARAPDPAAYPPSVLEPWRRAWAEHVLEQGAGLGVTPGEARWLGARLDVDLVARVVVMAHDETFVVRLQVVETATSGIVSEVVLQGPRDAASIESALTMAISDAAACLPPRAPPDAESRPPARIDAAVAYAGGTFLDGPTTRRLYLQGISLRADWMRRPAIGVYGVVRAVFAGDGAGDELVERLDVVDVAGGFRQELRLGRARLVAGVGARLQRTGEVRATTSFWCRASGGEPQVFDDERA